MKFKLASEVEQRDRTKYLQQWHLKNRKRRLSDRKERYRKNRELELEKSAEYQKSHPDVARRKYRNWASKNKPYLAARMGEYRKQHKHERTTTPQERERIRSWCKIIKSKSFVECHWCHKVFPVSEIEFDHIIPVSKSGRHVVENMCPSCIHCNRVKSAKIIIDYEI